MPRMKSMTQGMTGLLLSALMLFAFLSPHAGGPRPAAAASIEPQRENLQDIFRRKLAYTLSSPFYKELHTPHLRRFLPKPWKARSGEVLIDGSWSLRTEGGIQEPGPFALKEIETFFLDAGGFCLKSAPSEKEIVLRRAGEAGNRMEADGYVLTVSSRRIEISSPSWRGVLYGVYYLEDLLLERGAPAVKFQSIRRSPLFDVRMFGDVYGTFTISGLRLERPVDQNTFSALSRFGANATFSFVQLGDYLGNSIYPELNNPDREKNLAELSRLAGLAKSAGIDLYLDAYNPKLPENHPVFIAHPNARGATQHGGAMRTLCPSDPETLSYIAESWADVFRRVPSLGGMVMIIGGEGFYHCYMRADKGGPDCPRCRRRSAEEVVADLTNAVFRAIRKVKPDAELFAWPYSAFLWSRDPFQLDLIARLDPGIHIVPEIDKDFHYRKNGYVKDIWDYSIDFIGPSDRYRAMAAAAAKRGLKVACKTETAVSLENNAVPYIPCLQRWGKRMEVIRAEKPDSIYYAYDITGFTRSRPEELAGRLSWIPSGTADEELRKIAIRDFGPSAAAPVMEGWKLFSEAMGHTPYLTHGYYMGPSFIGPGQPLMLIEENMPPGLSGRFFYLAEEDLSEGTSQASKLRPVYASNIAVSPAEMADMDKAAALWDRGVKRLEAARSKIDDPYLREFERELDLASYLRTVFRAISGANHFFSRKAEFQKLAAAPGLSAEGRRRALELLDDMEKIVKADLENARRGLAVARREPRLDLAVRLDLDYQPLWRIIESKIEYAENAVPAQFEAARVSLSK